ncbi:hypothetical protein DFH09DRAFT_896192 [Mycena vulgaris]|nr:hypothetical protein DFH09DRAFT_896192 [Mycena vulgaris]
MFLDETLRGKGLGDFLGDPRCSCCPAQRDEAAETTAPVSRQLFRCADCGIFLQCLACVISRHAFQPMHVLKEWTGRFWEDVMLCSLGLVYQVGHGDLPCITPVNPARTMVVIHTNGIHTVHFRYCGCGLSDNANNLEQLLRNNWYPATTVDPAMCTTFKSLELYRLLNVVGNINVHDFVRTLEQLTDPTKIKPIPISRRSHAFGRMTRQYAFLKRAKRAGRGHNILGLNGTVNGGYTVLCWVCPQDGINLPEGWRDVAHEFRFLYMLLLAVDANFRLKNRIHKNEVDDPSLGSGWGYLVEEKPYCKHLKGYVSTCIAFAALLQKDTRMTTGLRCSGTGGVVCARHELVRLQGIGDLQKGERYSNMDYIFLSSIMGLTLLFITVSYNIACQWPINMANRMTKMPANLKMDSAVEMQYGLPVWHAAAHEMEYQSKNSLNYLEGVGQTDGEGIERTWSGLNLVGWATKEMGNGARHDALEDKIDHHNFEKNISQGDTLARKLVVAIEERDVQVAAFVQINNTLRSDLRKEWQAKVDAYNANRMKENPYEPKGGKRSGPSEVSVRLELKKDEAKETVDTAASVHSKGATAFLVAGMQLEETQRWIKSELKGSRVLITDQNNHVEEFRLSFMSKLRTFRDLWAKHMPAATQALEDEEEVRDADAVSLNPEDVVLWMPSELRESQRVWGCVKGLTDKEVKLREAQCSKALDNLCRRLHSKRHFVQFRNSHVVGQRQSTRSNTLIAQVGERINTIVAKYRRAWKALGMLKGRVYCEKKGFRELTAADISLDEEQEADSKARHRLGKIGTGRFCHKNEPSRKAKAKKTFSWIWTARGGPGENKDDLHESMLAVHVDWSKALAQKVRWTEEVQLLQEEMRCVMRFLECRANWWEGQRGAWGARLSPALQSGLDAYAAHQAERHRQIALQFKTGWDMSAAAVVRNAALEDALLAEGMASYTVTAGI